MPAHVEVKNVDTGAKEDGELVVNIDGDAPRVVTLTVDDAGTQSEACVYDFTPEGGCTGSY